MAILNSCCCCWKSVRKGSYVCAVYSMVYYIILSVYLWQYLADEVDLSHDSVIVPHDQFPHHVSVIHNMGKAMFFLSLAGPPACLLLVVGLWKDQKYLLLPWIVNTATFILIDLVFVIYIAYQEKMNMNPGVAMLYTLDFFLLVLNTYAVLCVTSQFQEYLAGRGRAQDLLACQPSVLYAQKSTANSVADSARRTVTFLEEGTVKSNGASSSHPSSAAAISTIPENPDNEYDDISRPKNAGHLKLVPSISVTSEVLTEAQPESLAAVYDSCHLESRGSKKRVQFPEVEKNAVEGEHDPDHSRSVWKQNHSSRINWKANRAAPPSFQEEKEATPLISTTTVEDSKKF